MREGTIWQSHDCADSGSHKGTGFWDDSPAADEGVGQAEIDHLFPGQRIGRRTAADIDGPMNHQVDERVLGLMAYLTSSISFPGAETESFDDFILCLYPLLRETGKVRFTIWMHLVDGISLFSAAATKVDDRSQPTKIT